MQKKHISFVGFPRFAYALHYCFIYFTHFSTKLFGVFFHTAKSPCCVSWLNFSIKKAHLLWTNRGQNEKSGRIFTPYHFFEEYMEKENRVV